MIGAQIVTALQTLVARVIDPTEEAVVTVGTFQAGLAFNVIPEPPSWAGPCVPSLPRTEICSRSE